MDENLSPDAEEAASEAEAILRELETLEARFDAFIARHYETLPRKTQSSLQNSLRGLSYPIVPLRSVRSDLERARNDATRRDHPPVPRYDAHTLMMADKLKMTPDEFLALQRQREKEVTAIAAKGSISQQIAALGEAGRADR